MDSLLRLSNKTDENNNVDLIANKTKKNYVNLRGVNNEDTIDCVHMFMCQNHIWNEDDIVILTRKPYNFVPPGFDNISCVLNFYNKAIEESELHAQMQKEESAMNQPYCHAESCSQDVENKKQIIVKQLTNPNIPYPDIQNYTSVPPQDKKKSKHEKIIDEESNSMDEVVQLIESETKSNEKKLKYSEKNDDLSSSISNSEVSNNILSDKSKSESQYSDSDVNIDELDNTESDRTEEFYVSDESESSSPKKRQVGKTSTKKSSSAKKSPIAKKSSSTKKSPIAKKSSSTKKSSSAKKSPIAKKSSSTKKSSSAKKSPITKKSVSAKNRKPDVKNVVKKQPISQKSIVATGSKSVKKKVSGKKPKK